MLNQEVAPWHAFTSTEVESISGLLASGWVDYGTGEEGRMLEREFAGWAGADGAVVVANGKVALDLQGLGIGLDDEVIVTPRTLAAAISCVANAGAGAIDGVLRQDAPSDGNGRFNEPVLAD